MLVAGATASSLKFVGGKEAHVAADARDAEPWMGRLHRLAIACDYAEQRGTQKCTG